MSTGWPLQSLHRTVRRGPRVLIINDTSDQENWGSQALMHGLRALIADAFPDAQCETIPSHWLIAWQTGEFYRERDAGPEAGCPRVTDQFDAVADLWCRSRGRTPVHRLVERLRSADLVLYNGEGSLYRRNLSARQALFMLWLAKTRLNIPSVLANATLSLGHVDPILPGMVRRTLPLLDSVAVREPWSLRNLNEHVPHANAMLVPDSAFHLASVVPDLTSRAPRAPCEDPGYFCYSAGMMQPDHEFGGRSALHRLIAALKNIVPKAILVARSPQDVFLEQVAKDTGSVYWGPGKTYYDLMCLLRGAAFQLSGRYHHLILGSLVGCPAVAFASASHKVHGLCELLEGVFGEAWDPGDLEQANEAIIQRCVSYVSDRDAWSDRITAVAAARTAELSALKQRVRSLLEA